MLTLNKLPESFDEYVLWRGGAVNAIMDAGEFEPDLVLRYLNELDDRTVPETRFNELLHPMLRRLDWKLYTQIHRCLQSQGHLDLSQDLTADVPRGEGRGAFRFLDVHFRFEMVYLMNKSSRRLKEAKPAAMKDVGLFLSTFRYDLGKS